MQIPILSGIYADDQMSLRTAYPVNMEPIPKNSGYSQGYLRPTEGLFSSGTGPGICRAVLEWDGLVYRIMGDTLCSIGGNGLFQIGALGADTDGPARMAGGVDLMAIASDNRLFFYNKFLGNQITENTDPDFGVVKDVVHLDGYFLTTDGEFIVSSELSNPFSALPDRYASSEEDPDAIVALEAINGELHVINRYTIEIFRNVGGNGFPFQVVPGAQAYRGAVGVNAVTQFLGRIAFLGSGKGEAFGVYVATSSMPAAISTSEIEEIINTFTEAELRNVLCETRRINRRNLLYVHLPDQTLVYDATASEALGSPVWFILKSNGAYRGRYFAFSRFEGWTACDSQSGLYGVVTENDSLHWDTEVQWEFSTPVVFNEAQAMICHEATLTSIIGDGGVAVSGQVQLSTTQDGRTYSDLGVLPIKIEVPLRWTRLGYFESQFAMRFSGGSATRIAPARLDVTIEPLR